MNRTCQLTIGTVVLVACATGAHEARATGPTAPATTVTAPIVPLTPYITVGPPATVRVSAGIRVLPRPIAIDQNSPFEHTFLAKGARVYLAAKEYDSHNVIVDSDIYVSADSGRTWTSGAVYPTPNQSCANVAIDAGNPDVVYLTYYSGHANTSGNTGTTLRLAVSTDGGRTFPASYIIADSGNSLADLICPDIVSPKPGTVIVSGIVVGNIAASNTNYSYAATWVGTNQGQTIGPATTTPAGVDPYYSPSDTNASSMQPGCMLQSNSGTRGPRLFTNGAGTVCVAYVENAYCMHSSNAHFVQCSADSGATWTTRRDIGTGNEPVLFGAVSPSGNNVVLAWRKTLTHDEILLVFSHDGGKTFPELREYPSPSRNAISQGAYTGRPVVAWESDSALWLAQTLDQSDSPMLMLDRTVDEGKSWIGAVNAGPYMGTSLLSTANGMVATGFGKGSLTSVTIPLGVAVR